jgi:hypothetical protein
MDPLNPAIATEIHMQQPQPKRRFEIAVVATGTTWYHHLSLPNKVAYSLVHNYNLHIARKPVPNDGDRDGNWQKIQHAMDVMQVAVHRQRHTTDETWILVIDADAYFMNMSKPLDSVVDAAMQLHGGSKRLEFIAAEDCSMINSGVFMIRASNWGLHFLNTVWHSNSSDIYMIRDWKDQAALKHVVDKVSNVKEHTQYVPMQVMNSYPPLDYFMGSPCYHKYQPGDLILHFVGGSKHLMLDFQEQIKQINAAVLQQGALNTSRWERH